MSALLFRLFVIEEMDFLHKNSNYPRRLSPNENYERMERISEDTGWNNFHVTLTDEELSFVKLTVFLSGMENGKTILPVFLQHFRC